jgi:hypothetical protein
MSGTQVRPGQLFIGRLVGVPILGVLAEDGKGEMCPEEGLQLVENLVAIWHR